MKEELNTNLIKSLIKIKGYKIREFCAIAKVPYNIYLKLMRHDYDLDVKYLLRIANTLEIHISLLFYKF